MSDWNPRYLAYAAAHGRDPDAMLAHDREAWSGGCMVGFICWISDGMADWLRVRGVKREAVCMTDETTAADFTAFLQARTTEAP